MVERKLQIVLEVRNKINILSTGILDNELVERIRSKRLAIDQAAFIETEALTDESITRELDKLVEKELWAVFTSQVALKSLISRLNGRKPNWKIFCTSGYTKFVAGNYFGKNAIIATAPSATDLAENIIHLHAGQELVFFCGRQRRDDLPLVLKKAGIPFIEIEIYQTLITPVKKDKDYDAILFFSPSAVRSYFSVNRPGAGTVLFAIGKTTADEIKKHSDNSVISTGEPGKENLVNAMIEYFISKNKGQRVKDPGN